MTTIFSSLPTLRDLPDGEAFVIVNIKSEDDNTYTMRDTPYYKRKMDNGTAYCLDLNDFRECQFHGGLMVLPLPRLSVAIKMCDPKVKV